MPVLEILKEWYHKNDAACEWHLLMDNDKFEGENYLYRGKCDYLSHRVL